jgi:hypothetical protein
MLKLLITYLVATFGREKGRHRHFLPNDTSKEN